MQIVKIKCPDIFLSGAMCRFCSANLCNLDIKYNNLCYVVEGFREGILH